MISTLLQASVWINKQLPLVCFEQADELCVAPCTTSPTLMPSAAPTTPRPSRAPTPPTPQRPPAWCSSEQTLIALVALVALITLITPNRCSLSSDEQTYDGNVRSHSHKHQGLSP